MPENNYKDKVLKSIEHYSKKDAKTRYRVPKKNNSPESDFVIKELMPWFKKNKFDMDIVESKAVYSKAAGMYLHGQATKGMSDCVGNDRFGRGAWVEAKAKGSKVLRQDQKDFLIRKIESNCFAVCVQSIDEIETYYREFMTFNLTKAQIYLKSLLNLIPVKQNLKDRSCKDDTLFED